MTSQSHKPHHNLQDATGGLLCVEEEDEAEEFEEPGNVTIAMNNLI